MHTELFPSGNTLREIVDGKIVIQLWADAAGKHSLNVRLGDDHCAKKNIQLLMTEFARTCEKHGLTPCSSREKALAFLRQTRGYGVLHAQ